MGLRTSKTEKNIRNAFIELRSKKTIEKISIKELTELASVNKSTFYRHYTDIYALSENIEDDLVESCMEMVAGPDKLLEKEGILSLINALDAQSNIFNIIFSDSRKDAAIHKIHYRFMKKLLAQHPEYQDDMEKKNHANHPHLRDGAVLSDLFRPGRKPGHHIEQLCKIESGPVK